MRHEIDSEGKLKLSLTAKEWVGLIFGLVALIGAIVAKSIQDHDLKELVEKHERACAKADSAEVHEDQWITNHEWRIKRLERKAKIGHWHLHSADDDD